MWVTMAKDPTHLASYRVFNADGSEVEQCGNGVRCVARILAGDRQSSDAFTLESPAGLVSARLIEGGRVSVSMGAPEFEPGRIPFVAEKRSLPYSLEVDGRNLEILVVSMGNPHCILQVADVTAAPVGKLGPILEHHPRFPERTNVGFMRLRDRANIELRVHERGVGETLACGTGASAAVVCGRELGLLDSEVTVSLPGGKVVVSWLGGCDPVWLTGDAELISEGTVDV